MKKNVFNPEYQQEDISGKIVFGLGRISEVYKALLWDKAKVAGLSPIQIQLLLFIDSHRDDFCNISHLAKEFNVTKPTISDAIKVLHKKELIIKNHSQTDSRSYTIALSPSGHQIINPTINFAQPLQAQIDTLKKEQIEDLFKTLSELIYKLNRSGILQVQRTCFACKYYKKNNDTHYCSLMEKQLQNQEIRLDCPEFSE
ncbi:MarR family transcriptional regulator [Zhouia spongiae]|uniref:MarR family transcriptional regulator n=1 Tax=Zhouia spongiae TaxID=2202721 RepID=A0ABY3YJQ3_9FLAO|nr:MarR family winged helix-turn-helix transcriptional regulator [Zhouia spongiae]UNY97731.1 MarR family transcriptional regulator [Zhouia spongiae]